MNKPEATIDNLTNHFFRHEYAKIVAVITRYFGTGAIEKGEDIVQDTLLEAIKNWEFNGLPSNPTAWLYTVAKNKALNVLRKDKVERKYELTTYNHSTDYFEKPVEELFTDKQISDDLLRMIFVCCHPSISQDAQVALILKTLCGLSISEIANAYLTTIETINKRLVRSRKTIKENGIHFSIPGEKEIDARLDTVLKAIYLLFNEGYNASKGEKVIRYDLCLEAIRLANIMVNHNHLANDTNVHALLSLMLLNASRFQARLKKDESIVQMEHQDRSLWNQELIQKGLFHLEVVKKSKHVSIYHILAIISAHHCTAPDYESTDWPSILKLYDSLIKFDSSPIIKLNRAIALSKVHGNVEAISEILKLQSTELKEYYLLYATIAQLYMQEQQFNKAIQYFKKAILYTDINMEISMLEDKINECAKKKVK